MKQMLLYCLILLGVCISSLRAQTNATGLLKGSVKDDSLEGIPFAQVGLFKDSILCTGAVADIDGNYKVEHIPAGTYDIVTKAIGYSQKNITQVKIKQDSIIYLDIALYATGIDISTMNIMYCKPTMAADLTVQDQTWDRENILRLPGRGASRNVKSTRSLDSRQTELFIRGSRGNMPLQSGPSRRFYNGNSDEYNNFEDNDFLASSLHPLSTFSVDVDKASYAIIRKHINDGILPPHGAVRLEEMINYFDYNYPGPIDQHPFNIISELTDCPWNAESQIVKIALQGKRINESDLPPSVFTFLIDVSGSMQSSNKLPLVKASLLKLLDKMRPDDKVGIVVYAGAAGIVLEPTPAKSKKNIVQKISEMEAGGSTAGGEGIQLAYKLAEEHFLKSGNNRIILCTDGDFNVGVQSDVALGDLIEKEREKGIFLTVLGYGMGNYKDTKLEMLADKGNGNYAYIDDYDEAEKFLGVEFAGSMYTIAKDVKVQVEFNPAIVKSYRLIGYENRMLQAEDFNNDKKDAGEIGAGHTVTAIYEIRTDEKFCKKIDALKYHKTDDGLRTNNITEIASIKFRYKEPDKNESILITKTLENKPISLQNADESTRFAIAVAAFGMTLRKSKYIKYLPLSTVILMASEALSFDKDNREEFVKIVHAYTKLSIAKQ